MVRKYLLAVFLLISSSCSPVYVLRAGWEEANILWRREDISKLLKNGETDPELKEKLALVLQAREFAAEIGLEPGGSYTQYSALDRDVLVWVLSASPSIEISSYTWWFPIVGRVPYKGYFEKEQGLAEAERLKRKGYDILLRPSPAFSTLGWFNDPLLSTMTAFDSVSLVGTVIHEIFHNTVWIPNHVAFNETLANIVGTVGAYQFFDEFGESGAELAREAQARWEDELLYASFLHTAKERLEKFYQELPAEIDRDNVPQEILTKRKEIFAELQKHWAEQESRLQTKIFNGHAQRLNNAVIISNLVYLDRPWLFRELLDFHDFSLPAFIQDIKAIEQQVRKTKEDPFSLLERRLRELRATELG